MLRASRTFQGAILAVGLRVLCGVLRSVGKDLDEQSMKGLTVYIQAARFSYL
jgi:hypothetical protein